MSPWKKTLLQQGMKLMADPRVAKLMQDERVTKALMAAMSVPSKAQSFAKEQAENIAKVMSLATEDEVKDLRRTVRRLEEDLARLRGDQGPSNGTTAGAAAGKKKSTAAG